MRSRIAVVAVVCALLGGVFGVAPGRAQAPDITDPAGDTYQDLFLTKASLVDDVDPDIVTGDATVSPDGQTITLVTTVVGRAGSASVSWDFQYGYFTFWVTGRGGRISLNAGGTRSDGGYAGFSRDCPSCTYTATGSTVTMTFPSSAVVEAVLDYSGSVIDVTPGYVFPAVLILSQVYANGLVPTAADRTSTLPVAV